MKSSMKKTFGVGLALVTLSWTACARDHEMARSHDATKEIPSAEPPAHELAKNADRQRAVESFQREQLACIERLTSQISAFSGARADDQKSRDDGAARRARLQNDLAEVQIASMQEWPALRARVESDLQESANADDARRTARARSNAQPRALSTPSSESSVHPAYPDTPRPGSPRIPLSPPDMMPSRP